MEPVKKVEILQKVELPGKGKLILSRALTSEIDYLHKLVGNIEWIGILFYTKVGGELSDPSSLLLRADKVFLMDIGTAGHTEAIMDSEEVLNMYDQIPDSMSYKQGLIHTHHSMDAFFSGEDWSELNDNVGLHHYYLSLIVNHKGTYVAKVAYVAENENKFKYKDSDDKEIIAQYVSKVMVVIDLDIIREDRYVEPYFADRYTYVKDKIEAAKKPVITTYGTTAYRSGPPSHWSGWEDSVQEHSIDKDDQGEVDQKATFPGGNNYYRKPSDILTYNQSKEMCLEWLNEGLRLESIEGTKPFVTVSQGMSWFSDYFGDNNTTPGYMKWLNQMQRILVDVSAEFQPSITAKRVSTQMREFAYPSFSKKLAIDLSKVAEAHPAFLSIMRKTEKKNKKNKQQREIEEWKLI